MRMKMSSRRLLKAVVMTLAWGIGIFAALQLIPYGRTHENPPVTQEPQWDSPRTRELAVRACFDCHSNETRWPWYANLAPFSWVVQRDVDSAREVVNFSVWNAKYDLAGWSGHSVRSGTMPPTKYTVAHPEAQLTPAELEELARGLDATMPPR